MSFINDGVKGLTYAPGYFLKNNEDCTRETKQVSADMGKVTANGTYVPMGTVFPEVGDKAEGIVYEDVDVTFGDMPASIVTKGEVYLDKLPTTIYTASTAMYTASTIMALENKGFKFTEKSPEVTRPEF